MPNNVLLQNAALAGFMGGSLHAQPNSATAGDYADIAAAGAAFAAAVDNAIAADGTIVTPTTAATIAKVNLLQALCLGVMAGRNSKSTTGWTTLANAVAAAYTRGVTVLV